ncbi:MAG: redox-regulated ATPase YchF [Pseudodesulfovibrio sp.]|nr:redox-regulated ATPase YchF [Pseudodesulfovibrio sp.]
MKTAIFGFSGSGKTDLFAALSGPAAAAAGNRAMIKVHDQRLDPLITLFNPKKITYSEIEYLDIPGGGGKGTGLGERVLNEIRPYDCFIGVLDGFSGMNNPEHQWQAIEADMMVTDMAVIEKRLEKITTDKKKNKALVDPKEEETLKQALNLLENEHPLRTNSDISDKPELKGYKFLSARPILYAWNCPEGEEENMKLPENAPGMTHIAISAKLERELAEIDDPEEKAMFLQDLEITESVLDKVITKTYHLLGLISYLTAGEDECRTWPLRAGSTAPQAAGVIHTDFEKGFIRAEIIGYQDFIEAGNFKKAKELGLARLEGKEYIVQDGDIIEFRFNV